MILRRPMLLALVFLFLGVVLLVIFPHLASAAGVLYPGCDGINCQLCHLFSLADKILKYLIYIAVPIAACLIAWAGFLYLTSGGNTENASRAKRIFGDLLLGFIIALLGFVIVDTILQSLGAGYLKGPSWRGVDCSMNRNLTGGGLGFSGVQNSNPTNTNTVVPVPTPTTGTSNPMGDAQARAAFEQANIPIVSTGNCSNPSNNTCTALNLASQAIVDATIALRDASGQQLRVSGGNEVGHENSQQQYGNSLDISFQNATLKTNAEAINSVINAARAQGTCAVWEPGIGNTCPSGVTSRCLMGYGTDGHFSLYLHPSASPSCSM